MASQPTSQVHKQPAASGSPYCSDPNCEYCKELRLAQEQLQQGKIMVASRGSA